MHVYVCVYTEKCLKGSLQKKHHDYLSLYDFSLAFIFLFILFWVEFLNDHMLFL